MCAKPKSVWSMEPVNTLTSKSKMVRFADESSSCVLVYAAEEALSSLWLQPEEYQDLRQRAREHTEYLKTKGYGILLKNGFKEDDKLVQKHINAFSQLPGKEYPRGFEAYISQQHRDEVDRIHAKVTQGVLNRQKLLREKNLPTEVVLDKLRSVSRKHSRSSRVLARRMGIADRRAVVDGDDFFKAQAMVKGLNQGNAKMIHRKASVEDMRDPGQKVGESRIFGLTYLASHTVQKNRTKPARGALSTAAALRSDQNNCVSLIQEALNVLELGEDRDDDPFSTPKFYPGTAKTA